MKKALLIIVGLALLGSASALVTRHYQNYQNKKEATQQAQVVAKADEVKKVKASAAAEYAALVLAYNKVQAECQKGKALYDSLALYQQNIAKVRNQIPSCGLPQTNIVAR